MRSLGQLSLGPLSLRDSGHELLQLGLQFLPLVFGLGLCLLQALDLAGQLLVGTVLAQLSFLQVGLELHEQQISGLCLSLWWVGIPVIGERRYPLGLLQIFGQLLQGGGMPLSHLLDLRFVVFSLLLDCLLQLCNLLFALCPTKSRYRTKC